jgi:hypothetical protein
MAVSCGEGEEPGTLRTLMVASGDGGVIVSTILLLPAGSGAMGDRELDDQRCNVVLERFC